MCASDRRQHTDIRVGAVTRLPPCFKEGELIEKSGHPTAMMLTSTVNLLKTLSLSAGMYAEVLQMDAIRTLCGLLRMLVESGVNDKSSK